MVENIKHSAKNIISFALILCYTVLGIIGLVLPFIPGVLFLIIAALLASRHYPPLARFLERNRYTANSLKISKGFLNLDVWGKVRLCFWGFLKITMDGVRWTVYVVAKVFRKGVRS